MSNDNQDVIKPWNKENLEGYLDVVTVSALGGAKITYRKLFKESGYFNANRTGVKSLVGIPLDWNNSIYAVGNQLSTFDGIPPVLSGTICLSENHFETLHHIHKHILELSGILMIEHNRIKSHVLGLLKIKKLIRVVFDNKNVEDIINKYLPEGDILECQQELIDAGFEEYAQL